MTNRPPLRQSSACALEIGACAGSQSGTGVAAGQEPNEAVFTIAERMEGGNTVREVSRTLLKQRLLIQAVH